MKLLKITALLLMGTTPAIAQHAHNGHMDTAITEAGQAQFASIAEIVAVLQDDPSTNWENVNIQALRDHLVDMDNVTTRSTVVTVNREAGLEFTVTGKGDVVLSIQNMVTAHSPMLGSETGWSVISAIVPGGASMTITVGDQKELNKLSGLGFYGVMTIGAHHQQHHLMIAAGKSPH